VVEDEAIRRRAGDGQGIASAAACAEALMADTVRILSRCMELYPTSPSSHLKAEMCAAILRVVDRCAIDRAIFLHVC
jgi:hypothetical protein